MTAADSATVISPEKARLNIALREEANELIALVGDKPDRFWECLIDGARKKLPTVHAERRQVMTYEEAVKFERVRMDYPTSKWYNHPIGEAPTSYWTWWLDQAQTQFNKLLMAYIGSVRFKERQDKGE